MAVPEWGMDRDQLLRLLQAHREELESLGVVSVSLFGSAARGEENPRDVDLAVRLSADFSAKGFAYFGQLAELEERLSGLLGCRVDVVEEPARRKRFQDQIERDRAVAF